MFYMHPLMSIVTLLLVSGIILLLIDQQIYRINNMTREKGFARIFGWVQLGLSFALFVGNLAFSLFS